MPNRVILWLSLKWWFLEASYQCKILYSNPSRKILIYISIQAGAFVIMVLMWNQYILVHSRYTQFATLNHHNTIKRQYVSPNNEVRNWYKAFEDVWGFCQKKAFVITEKIINQEKKDLNSELSGRCILVYF